MIKKNMALIELAQHLQNEYAASFAYKANYIAFEKLGFHGFSKWFNESSEEEIEHANKIINYLIQNDEFLFDLPDLSINAPTPMLTLESFKEQVIDIFVKIYELEVSVTIKINEIMSIATEEKDYETIEFLGWYVVEQQNSIKEITDIINKLKISDECGILFLDKCFMNVNFSL